MSAPSFVHPENLWRELGLSAGQTIVHLGSGPGFYLVPAAHLVGTSGSAIGIEIRADMISETQSRAKAEKVDSIVKTIRADLEQSNGSTLPDSSVDWVLVANILHQANPEAILKEANRVVKTSGTVVIIEWDTVATPLGPPVDARISRQSTADAAAASNLVLHKEFNPSPYHYGLLFKKAG